VGVVRALVVLVLKRTFVVGREVVALAGRGRDLDQISEVIDNFQSAPSGYRKSILSIRSPMNQFISH
jgi:hypothetical protein